MKISRKDFLKAGMAVVTSAVALQACGDDESTTTSGPTSGPTTAGGANNTGPVTVGGGSTSTSNGGSGGTMACNACGTVTAAIGTNHGHTINVPESDVAAGAEMTYDIMGTSPHGHTVTVTGADFAVLQMCGSVMITSSDGGAHTHNVTITCAA